MTIRTKKLFCITLLLIIWEEKILYSKKDRLQSGFLTIGEMAKAAGVPVSTIRYYTDIGLLDVKAKTESGYRLYNKQISLKIIHLIKPSFERRRSSLTEIKKSLHKKLFKNDTPKIQGIRKQPVQVLKKERKEK